MFNTPYPRVKLGDVLTVDRMSISAAKIGAGRLYVGLENIDSRGCFIDVKRTSENDIKSSKFNFSNHHILYGKLRPYLRKIARPDFSGICSTDILPLNCGVEMDRDFVFHFLRKRDTVQMATSRCTGANLPRLSPKNLLEFTIPKPPLNEQKRIANILNCAYEIEMAAIKAGEIKEELKRAIFLDMFGNPVSTEKWPRIRFLEGVSDVTRSQKKLPKKDYLDDGVLPVIDQGKTQIGGWTKDSSLQCTIEPPCIVFGDHTGIIKFIDFPFVLGADGVKILIPKHDHFDTLFLCHMLRFLPLPDVGYSRHFKFLKEFSLICPPKELQIKFNEAISIIDGMEQIEDLASQNSASISKEVLV